MKKDVKEYYTLRSHYDSNTQGKSVCYFLSSLAKMSDLEAFLLGYFVCDILTEHFICV